VVVLSPAARTADAKAAFERAQVVAGAVARTRDWVNEPPGDFTPALFADAVTEAHRATTKGRGAPAVELEVLDEQQLAELGAGGILAVGAGSDAPPRLVRLTYRPDDAVTHVALVGKGITYDSGGLTIKPAASMTGMKADMAGAASVVQATLALAALGVPVAITCLAPMAENMVSGRSFRPGDVVTTLSGRTVEITNTDAEGRMVLCDALTLAVQAEPDVVVDVATLTGHMQIALGDQVAAVMGSDEVVADVLAAAELTGEPHWPMPIPEEMTERVTTGTVADLLQHDWVRWGGGLRAAAFLREFVGDLPWGHLDIAGKELTGSTRGHLTAGATGFSTATVIAYVESLVR
jgi:leucyl aminopeptidase